MKATEKDDSDDQRRRVTSLTWQYQISVRAVIHRSESHFLCQHKDSQTLLHGFIHSNEDGDDDNDGSMFHVHELSSRLSPTDIHLGHALHEIKRDHQLCGTVVSHTAMCTGMQCFAVA